MEPFHNPLALAQRAAIRRHARHLRARADAVNAVFFALCAAALPSAYVLGMWAGCGACR